MVVRLDSLPGGAVLARVSGGGHADMREDARDRADGLGAPLAEHHAHVALQVLRVLDEAEPHGRLVAGAQVLLRHRRDRRGLTHAPHVNYNDKDTTNTYRAYPHTHTHLSGMYSNENKLVADKKHNECCNLADCTAAKTLEHGI